MKYYIIAGEASGDMHAAALMKELKRLDPSADFRCWGGEGMAAEGGILVKHYRDLAFMGFLEVAMNLRKILANLAFCKRDLLGYRPDALILVDYPGFNLRIAEFAHREGLKVFYYISPQVWAWKKSRVHKIRRDVDRMFVILPFEKGFYGQFGVDVEYVGHPLLDVVSEEIRSGAGKDFPELPGGSGKPVIALLPGSRKQEIRRMLPVMAGMASRFQGYSFVIAGAPGVEPGFYRAFPCARTLSVISGQTHRLLMHAHAALVTSGTATLETAMFGVPQVVCYKGSSLSYFIARQLVDVKYISLVNLITGREVVRELIQGGLTAKKLRRELSDILSGPGRDRVLAGYRDMMGMIGEPGAAARTASGILKAISAQGK